MNDIEIAKMHELKPIADIAELGGIPRDSLELYGEYKAKVLTEKLGANKNTSKLVLVTAINPTPAGEGKTTVSVGLADGLRAIGKRSVLALREPSLGPVFGMKGGAAGGGYAQVVPMEEINLHFTGDIHAITAANNLLAALIDNHIYQGNKLNIDSRSVTWRRCMDMNDRQLRHIIGGLGGKTDGTPREDGFDITAASEVMAILCLSESITDLKERLSRIIVGYSFDGVPVTAGQLSAHGAMATLLKEAIKPNLAQTLEGTPAFIHGGPFANIAHGCNSVIATKAALSVGEYVITEAGFGADLGAEKFLDIKCRAMGVYPNVAVVVATVRALKNHGGVKDVGIENVEAVKKGIPNLQKHIENLRNIFGLPVAVAINRFSTDTIAETDAIRESCVQLGVNAIVCDVWEKGGIGGAALAGEVVRLCEKNSATEPKFCYESELPLKDKITRIAKRIYGAGDVELAPGVLTKLKKYDAMGRFAVCIAKTQYSLSDNKRLVGRPEGFTLTIRDVKLSAGAGFVVAVSGDMILMPGLPKSPAAENIDIDGSGNITGLF